MWFVTLSDCIKTTSVYTDVQPVILDIYKIKLLKGADYIKANKIAHRKLCRIGLLESVKTTST